MREALLTVEELRYRYRRHGPWALDGLSFEVFASRVAVLGPNGAGKTTLLSVLSTALRSDAGTFRVGGVDVTRRKEIRAYRSALGVVPQHLEAMGGLRCRDFLRYVAWLRDVPAGVTEERVDRSLEAVALSDQAETRLSALSGGMRQRVSLAQALVNEPTVMLLDEPTVSLDPAQRDQFLSLVREVSERSTVLMTSHVAEDVAAFAKEVVMILDGRTVFAGTLAEFCSPTGAGAVTGEAVKRAYVERAGLDPSQAR